MPASSITSRIARARDSLVARLGELRRREQRVVAAVAPLRHLASPWLRVGVAVVVGYRIGRRGHPTPTPTGPEPALALATTAAPRESIGRAIVRASVVMAAQQLVRRAFRPDV